MAAIEYPYLPQGRSFTYVPETDVFMQAAREHALAHSLDDAVKTGSVVVVDGKIVGRGANGSDYHKSHECERTRLGMRTGEGYELCEGCHPKNHSEPKAIRDALSRVESVQNADLYLWGHWWACKSCWDAIQAAGIGRVFLQEDSKRIFDELHPQKKHT